MFDSHPKPPINTHPLICQPRQNEEGKNVSAPVVDQEFESGENENDNRNPVAKAIFAGKNIKEFSHQRISAGFILLFTKLLPFAEDLFLRDSPGNRCNNQRENHEPEDLS